MRLPFRKHVLDWVRPRADALVYASKAYVDLKSTQNEMAGDLIDFSREPEGSDDLALLQALGYLLPRQWPAERFVRVGGRSDGGYVMDRDLDVEGAISIGVGDDVSWDRALAERGIPVAAFDHTISELPSGVPGLEFRKLGLGVRSEGDLLALMDLIEMAGFVDSARLILKVDIEGNEWKAFADTETLDLRQFTQIAMELHDLNRLSSPTSADVMLRALRRIAGSHMPIHMHANNYGRLFRTTSYWFVDTLELLFVRKPRGENPGFADSIGFGLDAPCDPRVSDIDLQNSLTASRWFTQTNIDDE